MSLFSWKSSKIYNNYLNLQKEREDKFKKEREREREMGIKEQTLRKSSDSWGHTL